MWYRSQEPSHTFMETPDFSTSEVAARLDRVLASMPSDDAVAARLTEKAGYSTTGEKVRRARNGDVQKIAHDLLAAIGVAFEVDLTWLLTGKEPAPVGVEKGSDLEAEWLAALRDIRLSDAPRHQKMLDMDALAGVIGRIAWARGERAAEERARAVTSGDQLAAARMDKDHYPTSPAAPVTILAPSATSPAGGSVSVGRTGQAGHASQPQQPERRELAKP